MGACAVRSLDRASAAAQGARHRPHESLPNTIPEAARSRLDLVDVFTKLREDAAQFFERALQFSHCLASQDGRLRHFDVRAVALVLEPGDVEALAAIGDPLTREPSEAALLAGVLALSEALLAAQRILAERR